MSESKNKEKKTSLIHRLLEWTISWASHPLSSPALFGIAFIEASFFLIPPDALLIPLCLGKPKRAAYYATICTLGSVLGAFLGYYIGYAYFDVWGTKIADLYHLTDQLATIKVQLQNNAFGAIALAAFTPVPYKVFTIAAGIAHVPLMTLFTASIIARGTRYGLIAGIVYKLGPSAKQWIDKNFNRWSWIFGIAFILLLLAWKLLHSTT